MTPFFLVCLFFAWLLAGYLSLSSPLIVSRNFSPDTSHCVLRTLAQVKGKINMDVRSLVADAARRFKRKRPTSEVVIDAKKKLTLAALNVEVHSVFF